MTDNLIIYIILLGVSYYMMHRSSDRVFRWYTYLLLAALGISLWEWLVQAYSLLPASVDTLNFYVTMFLRVLLAVAAGAVTVKSIYPHLKKKMLQE